MITKRESDNSIVCLFYVGTHSKLNKFNTKTINSCRRLIRRSSSQLEHQSNMLVMLQVIQNPREKEILVSVLALCSKNKFSSVKIHGGASFTGKICIIPFELLDTYKSNSYIRAVYQNSNKYIEDVYKKYFFLKYIHFQHDT